MKVDTSGSGDHRARRADNGSLDGVEADTLDARAGLRGCVDQMVAVPPRVEPPAPERRHRQRFGRRENATGDFIDGGSPKAHDTAAAAQEIEIAAIGGPDGIPV